MGRTWDRRAAGAPEADAWRQERPPGLAPLPSLRLLPGRQRPASPSFRPAGVRGLAEARASFLGLALVAGTRLVPPLSCFHPKTGRCV